MNVLITGVGGPVGQSILKAARCTRFVDSIVGTDMQVNSVGLYKVDRAYVVPGALKDPQQYITSLKEICVEERIKAILVGSEPELETIARWRNSFWSELNVVVVVSTEEILNTALDKLRICNFLAQNGLRHPRYAVLSNRTQVENLLDAVGFPVMVKARHSAGSKGVIRVGNRHQLEQLSESHDDAVVQECLLPDDQEYTLGVFTCANGSPLDPIILHRELAAGLTYRAQVVRNDAISEEALKVAAAIRVFGPCNIQMRLTRSGPVTFEINPRFSSSTSMRAHFGYNEVEFALRNLVLGESLTRPIIKNGYAMRFWEELYRDELAEFPRKP